MKVDSVSIQGVRGIPSGTFSLGAVTVVAGPNGSGKTTILGSVLWVLTGRFPGLPAMSHGGAAFMSCRPNGSFRASLRCVAADGSAVEVTRAWEKGKGSVTLVEASQQACTGKAAEARILALFGDVSFMAEALSPEGSIWGLSRERRKAWAAGLCRSASGWTVERLISEVGPAELEWTPTLMPDPADTISLHVAKLKESVRDAQAVARQAETVVNTVSVDELTAPSEEDVERLRAEVAEGFAAHAKASELLVAPTEEVSARNKEFGQAVAERQFALIAVKKLEEGLAQGCCPTCGSKGSFERALNEERAKLSDARSAEVSARDALSASEQRLAEVEAQVRSMTALVSAQAKLDAAMATLALVREKAAQEHIAKDARERAEQLKELLERVTAARDKMLNESIAPMQKALAVLSRFAPHGFYWDMRLDDDALDIGMSNGQRFVAAESLSSGERFRLTTALMIARSMVREEPWTGIVFDGFEQVSDAERELALRELVSLQREGAFDNILLASAAPVRPVDGTTVISMEKT